MIEACININQGMLATLNQSAHTAGLNRNTLAQLLFRKALTARGLSKPKIFRRVQYQAADPEKRWEKVKIRLQGDLFEKCHDARKLLKLSVSALFADAILTYLDTVIKEYQAGTTEESKKMDNYENYYSIKCIFLDDILGFMVKWSKDTA